MKKQKRKIKKRIQNRRKIRIRIIAKRVAAVIALIAAMATILDFLGVGPTTKRDLVGSNPIRPSYVFGEDFPDLTWSNALYSQGIEAYGQCDYGVALERFEDALKEYENFSHADVDTAKIQYAIGMLYRRLGNLDMAIQCYTDAIGTLKSLPDTEGSRSELGYVYYLRGSSYLDNRDLPRAQLDCDECYNIVVQDRSDFVPTALSLRGKIYAASYYGTHSPFPVNGGTDLGVTWLEAMSCFEMALLHKGAETKVYMDETIPDDVIAVKAYNVNCLSTIEWKLIGEDVIKSISQYCYYIINEWDAETAVILNERAKLLSMKGDEGSVTDAIENCNMALYIYDNLPDEERWGIQETYWLLANAMCIKDTIHNQNITVDTRETYCYLMKEGLAYTEKWYGESYVTAVAYENMGSALMFAAQYEDAIENFEEAKRMFNALGLEEEAEKQNDFMEMSAELIGNEDSWELYPVLNNISGVLERKRQMPRLN